MKHNLTRAEKIRLTIVALVVAGGALWISNSRMGNDLDPASPDVTTIQQKWGCEPDEVVYFTEPVSCISEEQSIKLGTGEIQTPTTTKPAPYKP